MFVFDWIDEGMTPLARLQTKLFFKYVLCDFEPGLLWLQNWSSSLFLMFALGWRTLYNVLWTCTHSIPHLALGRGSEKKSKTEKEIDRSTREKNPNQEALHTKSHKELPELLRLGMHFHLIFSQLKCWRRKGHGKTFWSMKDHVHNGGAIRL